MLFYSLPGCSLNQTFLYTGTTCLFTFSSLTQPLPPCYHTFHTSMPLLKLFLLLEMPLPVSLGNFYLILTAQFKCLSLPNYPQSAEFIASSLNCLSYPTFPPPSSNGLLAPWEQGLYLSHLLFSKQLSISSRHSVNFV